MIGDWVLNTCGSLIQVAEVLEDGINGERNCEYYDDIKPIPLTPEILEKNRFLPSFEMGHETLCLVSSEYSVYYRPVDTYLYVFKRDNEQGEGDFIVSDHRNKNAKYVHELQHALRICGLDELADNFKI